MKNIHILAEDKLINAKQVTELCSISNRTLFNYLKDGRFPKPVRPNARTRRWRTCDVQNWINNQLEAA